MQPRRIDQTQERLTLLLVLVDPQMFVRVSVVDSLVHKIRVEYLKSIKVIIINLQLLYHNEEVIYLNLNRLGITQSFGRVVQEETDQMNV